MENNDNLSRKTMSKRLSNTLIQSPLRQSLYKNQQLDHNNDDKERSKQNAEILLQRRLSEIRSNTSNQLGRLFNELEAKEHFQNCHKLFSENKISTKNVWHMQIIDILSHVVREKKQKNLLQFAGTTLDISAKVYGIRVDDVHSFGLKLATNLTKSEKHNNDDDNNDSDNDDDQQNTTKKKTTRKRLKKRFQHNGGKKPTIDYDGALLFAPLKKLQKPPFSIDNKVNVGAVDNLLTMRLPLNPMGHTFRIFNKEKYRIKQRDITIDNKSIINIELPKIKNCKICPQFDDFIINQLDANYETQSNKSNNSNNEMIYDNNGLPIAELDGSIHDLLPVNDESDSTNDVCDDVEDVIEQRLQQEQPSVGSIFEIVNTIPLNELEVNEYGFNPVIQTVSGKCIDKVWAGPAHWKIKYLRRANLKCSGNTTTTNQQTGKTKRSKKVTQTIDLNSPEAAIINYDLTKKITNRRKSPSTDFEKVTLPFLCAKLLHFSKCEQELFLKPCTIRPQKSKNNENLEINVATYNYNNQNDSLYCSQIDFDDNSNNVENDCGNDNDNNIGEIEDFEQLIESPEMVQVSYLKYALHAKKINIKKLKKNIWEQLTHDNTEEKIEPVCFSKIYKTLPETLDTKTREELSVALAFNSVLYLCNEYCLKLSQTNYGNADFEIMKFRMPIQQTHTDISTAPQKLSKIETLRLARNYIVAMVQTLQEGRPMDLERFIQILSRDLSQTTANLLSGTLTANSTYYCENYNNNNQQFHNYCDYWSAATTTTTTATGYHFDYEIENQRNVQKYCENNCAVNQHCLYNIY